MTGIAVPNSTVEVFSDNEDEGQVFEGSLPLLGYESRPLTLTVDTPAAVDSTVSVYEVIDGNVMGGNTFHFVTEGPIYLPIILKGY